MRQRCRASMRGPRRIACTRLHIASIACTCPHIDSIACTRLHIASIACTRPHIDSIACTLPHIASIACTLLRIPGGVTQSVPSNRPWIGWSSIMIFKVRVTVALEAQSLLKETTSHKHWASPIYRRKRNEYKIWEVFMRIYGIMLNRFLDFAICRKPLLITAESVGASNLKENVPFRRLVSYYVSPPDVAKWSSVTTYLELFFFTVNCLTRRLLWKHHTCFAAACCDTPWRGSVTLVWHLSLVCWWYHNMQRHTSFRSCSCNNVTQVFT